MTRAEPAAAPALPALSFYILLALGEGPAHGWAIIKRIRALTEGASDPSSGSLYLAMIRLEESEMLEDSDPPRGESPDPRRRYYRLTPLGRRAAREEAARMERLVNEARRRRFLPQPRSGK